MDDPDPLINRLAPTFEWRPLYLILMALCIWGAAWVGWQLFWIAMHG